MSNTAFETIKPYLDQISSGERATLTEETIDAFDKFFLMASISTREYAYNYLPNSDARRLYLSLLEEYLFS